MTIKSDKWIRRMARDHAMIHPFVEKQAGEGTISYGLSSYGYDIRLSTEFYIFTNTYCATIDPKNMDFTAFVPHEGDHCIIPPNSFALGYSLEAFVIPTNVLTICLGKSTYARCGIVVNVTPFEPGWRGYATIEISNTAPLPVKVYANEGIAQILFFESDEQCENPYKGSYQDQGKKIVLPRVGRHELEPLMKGSN